MALYGLADLHLSININKPMDIFDGWENYVQKLAYNWKEKISVNDTVVLAGDLCWGTSLDEALPSFKFVNDLPGKKIILKGNHDYWWNTKTKIDKFFLENGLTTLNILFNNSYVIGKTCVCGSKGCLFESGNESNLKLINREKQRLITSIESGVKLGLPIVVFLHYPPIYGNQISESILEVLKYYKISKCYYGHLHGESTKLSVNGIVGDVYYKLISCDYVNFSPVEVS